MKDTLKKLDEVTDQAFKDYQNATGKTEKHRLLDVTLKILTVRYNLLKNSGYLAKGGEHIKSGH